MNRVVSKISRMPMLTHCNAYYLLDHNKVEKAKEKFFKGKERTLKLKIKFILKETKYTIVEGSKDLWTDAKWIFQLYRTKKTS